MGGTRTRVLAAALVLAAGTGLTACSGGGEEPVTEPSVTGVPADIQGGTTEPAAQSPPADDMEATTTNAPPVSAPDATEADTEETLKSYTRVLSDAFNGEASIEEIYPYSRDTAREKWVTEVMAAQAQTFTFSGLMEVELLEVSVEGDVAEAVACLDVSAVEAVDEHGDSVLADDLLDRTLQDYVLERDESARAGWYIVQDTNRNEPCDG